MKRERVQALLDGMRSVKDREDRGVEGVMFDIGLWGVKTRCGFAGCLIGWAAHEQWLKPHGVDIKIVQKPSPTYNTTIPSINGVLALSANIEVEDLLAEQLGLDGLTVAALIYSKGYEEEPTAAAVIDRLKYLLDHGEEAFSERFIAPPAGP